MLELSSDACPDISNVEVLVGDSTAPVATTGQCPANGQIGTLALVPSGRDGRAMVHVRALLKVSNATCDGPTPIGCLEATRSIAFVSHARLVLPISLDRACLGVSCKLGETCQKGMCVPTVVGPCANGRCNPLADAGPPADAGPVCVPPYVAPPTQARTWHFNESAGSPTTGDMASCAVVPVQAPAAIVESTLGCGNALDVGGPVSLACNADSLANASTFHVALWFRLTALTDGVLVQKLLSINDPGWAIVTKASGELWVQAHQGAKTLHVAFATALQIGRWYRLDVAIANALLKAVWLDGNLLPFGGSSPNYPSSSVSPVIVGPATAVVDELYLYK